MKTETSLKWRECRLGELFRQRKESGKPDLPTLSVTMNDGIVDRDTMERKTNGNLAADGHLLIRKGDLAYNMMRMWQGASGLAAKDGNVSPAYVVITPNEELDPVFVSYWFKSARMIYLFWAYSYGITGDRLRLYYKDFASIPVKVPAQADQVRFCNVLSAVDLSILRMKDLIAAKRELKRGLAQQLLLGEKRIDGRPDEWQDVRLADLVTILVSGVDKKSDPAERQIHLCNYTDVYYNDHISANGHFMVATASESEIKKYSLKKWDVIITKDSEAPDDIAKPAVVLEDIPGVLCGYHLAILRPKNVYGPFLAQLLRLPLVRHEFYRIANGVTRFGLGVPAMSSLRLRVPSHEEQVQLSAVLRTVDRQIGLLEEKVTSLEKLKKGLMEKLLKLPPTAKAG